MKSTKQWCLVFLACGVVLLASIAPAAARPFEREHFTDTSSEVVDDFCGSLRVRIDVHIEGSFLFNTQGPAGLAYAMEHDRGSVAYTNLANGMTYTETFRNVFKDLKVTDNGDGTLTILVMATGSNKAYGPDGRVFLNDPGQIRFEILIDHGGTPADPSDDEFIRNLGIVKGSTGRNDSEGHDFCDDVIMLIG